MCWYWHLDDQVNVSCNHSLSMSEVSVRTLESCIDFPRKLALSSTKNNRTPFDRKIALDEQRTCAVII